MSFFNLNKGPSFQQVSSQIKHVPKESSEIKLKMYQVQADLRALLSSQLDPPHAIAGGEPSITKSTNGTHTTAPNDDGYQKLVQVVQDADAFVKMRCDNYRKTQRVISDIETLQEQIGELLTELPSTQAKS